MQCVCKDHEDVIQKGEVVYLVEWSGNFALHYIVEEIKENCQACIPKQTPQLDGRGWLE